MSQTAAGQQRIEKWYNRNIFPLVPLIATRKADEYNTASFSFRWLVFTFWSLDAFQFELSFNVDTHWGMGIKFLLPYFRGVVAIPCPERLGIWIDRNLSRKSRHEKSQRENILQD
jgi:hypothetical protein